MELGEGYRVFSEWCRNGGIYKHGVKRTRFTQRVKAIVQAPETRKSGSRRYVAGVALLPDMRTQGGLDSAYDAYRDAPVNPEEAAADF